LPPAHPRRCWSSFEHRWGFDAGALTFAFAIYAIALPPALLVLGSLSDHIGRRPVLNGALLTQLVAMGMFFFRAPAAG
jgi:MFS family permease